jgi:hypothetical protein
VRIWAPFLNRAVNFSGGVNGETGEFEWLREAYAPNQHGSERTPVGSIANWRNGFERKYCGMFGIRMWRRWGMESTKAAG